MVKNLIQNLICLIFPSMLKIRILRFFGHKISAHASIGIVFLGKNCLLSLESGASVGHFNIISCSSLQLSQGAWVGSFNTFRGCFCVRISDKASLGNFNNFVNGGARLVSQEKLFSLGSYSNVTSRHYFDLTDDIKIGSQTVIGGIRSQFWTHGFKHFDMGTTRNRIDAAIKIGNGVYVGSGVIVNPGVSVVDEASIGAGAVVSKSITENHLYVSQPLRPIDQGENEFYCHHININIDNELLVGKLFRKSNFDCEDD